MSHHESDQPHDEPIPGSQEADAPSGPTDKEDNSASRERKSPEEETDQLPDLDQ